MSIVEDPFQGHPVYKLSKRSLKIIPEKRFDNSGRAGEI